MKITYCISTYNRKHLLDTSLYALSKQEFDKHEYEVIVVDDNSTEDIYGLCQKYKGKMNIRYLRLEHKQGWRDSAVGLNFALRRAKGEIWAISHPEIIISPLGLDILYNTHFLKYQINYTQASRDLMNMCVLLIPIGLTENQLFLLTDYANLSYGEILKKYYPALKESLKKSYKGLGNFSCLSMRAMIWKMLGGLEEFTSWGSVDPNLQGKRGGLRICDVVVSFLDKNRFHRYCLHQYHEPSEKAKIGIHQLEVRKNVFAKNLRDKHEEELKKQLVKDEYFKLAI